MSRDSEIVDYLLGELSPDERLAIEQRMHEDAGLRRDVDRMRPVVADLEALPAEAWHRGPIPSLPDLPPLRTSAPARRPRWPALRPVAAVAACAALIAAGVGIGALAFGGGVGEAGDGTRVALARIGEAAPGATGEARVVAADDGGLRLQVSGLDPSGPGAFYNLWLLDGTERLLSLGAFRVPSSGSAEVTVPLPVDLADFRHVDVSVEKDDGDPGHSGVSVLRGSIASA